MLTYKATNTKTNRYYIGSAGSYCLYMGRVGHHHNTKIKKPFQTDLQNNPLDFKWEILREDDLKTRDYEQELLFAHAQDPLCYNINKRVGKTNVPPPEVVFVNGDRWDSSVRKQMSKSQAENWDGNDQRRELVATKMTETNSKLKPCPHCGKLMNPGNLTQHIRAQTCQRKTG